MKKEFPILLFEVGALAKASVADIRTLLLDLEPRDVRQPLALFQHTKFNREGMRELVGTINKAVERGGGTALPDDDLDEVFEALWPGVENKVTRIMESAADVYPPPRTNDREVLEEILEAVRRLERSGETGPQRLAVAGPRLLALCYAAQARVLTEVQVRRPSPPTGRQPLGLC